MLLKDLTTLTASLVSGTLFHVEKSGKAYNIDYTKLAKAIVEEYNGSTLGGSAQTIQAAIGALNSSLIYGGFGVNLTKSYKLIDHNATLADFTNPGWYRLGGNDFDDTMKSATDGTAFPMTQKDYYIQVIGTDFNNGIRYGILNVYTPRHDFFVTGRIWNNSVSHWEKAPLRSEFDALNNNLGSLRTAITANANAIANVKTDLLGGYKLVGYTASVVLNKAGEFIIPYPSGENFGTVYGIASATFLQGGYCLPNPPLTPSSTSPAYDIQAAVAFRLLSTGIAIYTGGDWGADSRDIYFVLICKI